MTQPATDASATQPKFDLAAIRIQLEEELRKHAGYDAVRPMPSDDARPGCTNHVADSASVAEVQFTSDALRSTLGRIGQQVLRALKKIDEGTYGFCDSCKNAIEPERLDALIYATVCINCAGIKKH